MSLYFYKKCMYDIGDDFTWFKAKECEDKSVDVESQGRQSSKLIDSFHGSTFVHSLFLFTVHAFDYLSLFHFACFIHHHFISFLDTLTKPLMMHACMVKHAITIVHIYI
ncbi:hypothetical protein HanXRQr2_Chr09g0387991 [Helianthus annuus]|uniref:Uncharacterized protein n=1 Tax=Helianthus annuus TaxID=4232 RepID=A0A9K3I5G8_HELAN|nr:hypothetical protein HanXRQr2_Chr09g0387991 [Helianthus annuus]